MKKIGLTCLLLLPLFSLRSENDISSPILSTQAEAFWEARDDIAAKNLYEQLLSRPLPAWQQARVLYNLGTIQLTQQHPIEALTFFQKIHPSELSLPRFARDLFLNEALAYLQYAETLAMHASLDQQAIFIEQSLRAFGQAQKLDCQLQKEEQEENSSFSCQTSSLLEQWIKIARLKLYAVYQQKRQNWIDQASIESLASFLHQHMQEWLKHVNEVNIQEKSAVDKTSLTPYFQTQAESLAIIWNALQKKQFSLKQKEAFEQANAFYLSALQALNQQDLTSALSKWEQSIKALTLLNFQDQQELQQVRLNYEILLLQDTLTISALKNLIAQVKSLKGEKDQSTSIEQTQNHLKMSLENLQHHQPIQARFFLLAGLGQFETLLEAQKTAPAVILQQGINQASRALQLFFLSEMMETEKSKQILQSQQQSILTQVAPLIPSILADQENHFHESKDAHSSCQESPWDQVIPLYARGYQAAQRAHAQLGKASFDSQVILANQEQTIKDWQKALKLMLNPPKQSTGAATSQQQAETVGLIQEMYLQDQSQPDQPNKELHSW